MQRIDWHLDVDADAPSEPFDELKRLADRQCPGVYGVRTPVGLVTRVGPAS